MYEWDAVEYPAKCIDWEPYAFVVADFGSTTNSTAIP